MAGKPARVPMPRPAPALVALLLVWTGCDGLGEIDPVDPEAGVLVGSADDLADYRAAWLAAGVEDYRLRYDVVCFCEPSTVELEVRGGRIVRAETVRRPSEALTVLDLYDLALNAYADADFVTVRVRPGPAPLPLSVVIDVRAEIADEEVGYVVRAFEAG